MMGNPPDISIFEMTHPALRGALAGKTARLAVRYSPEASALRPLWSRVVEVAATDAGGSELLRVELPLHRLRARAKYTAELFVKLDDGDDAVAGRSTTTEFHTSDVEACSAFGHGAVADVVEYTDDDDAEGFSFEVLITAWIQSSCADWEGLVALDGEGWVVWYYNVSNPGPVGQLSGGDLVFLSGGVSLIQQYNAMRVDTDTHAMRSFSEGKAETWTAGGGCSCSGRCVWLSHEMRVVPGADGHEFVITERDTYVESPFGSEGIVVDGQIVVPQILHGYAYDLWAPADDGGEGTWGTLTDLTQSYQKFPHAKGMMNYGIQAAALDQAYTCGADDDTGEQNPDVVAATTRRGLRAASGFWGNDDYDGGYMDGAIDVNATASSAALEQDAWRTFNLWHASSGDLYGGWLFVCTLRNANAVLAFNVSNGNATLLWTLASTGALESDFVAKDGQEMNFYMPHAIEIISETQFMFIDDGGSRKGCKAYSNTNSKTDASCWSRAVMMGIDTDTWKAEIVREWAYPMYDYNYSSASAEYSAMAAEDDFNLVGGNINYLGDLGGGTDRYLVAFSDIVNASYRAFELKISSDDNSKFELVAELSYSNSHAEVTVGNYRMTPLLHLSGESSTAPFPVKDAEATMTSAAGHHTQLRRGLWPTWR
jgi:hypothetical protein